MKPSELKAQRYVCENDIDSRYSLELELFTADQISEALEDAMRAARTSGYEGWSTDEEKAWLARIEELREGK
jgi:hypothetical protein